MKTFGPLGDALGNLVMAIERLIVKMVYLIVQQFPEAIGDNADDRSIFLVSASIILIAVKEWIVFCPGVLCSAGTVMSLMPP